MQTVIVTLPDGNLGAFEIEDGSLYDDARDGRTLEDRVRYYGIQTAWEDRGDWFYAGTRRWITEPVLVNELEGLATSYQRTTGRVPKYPRKTNTV